MSAWVCCWNVGQHNSSLWRSVLGSAGRKSSTPGLHSPRVTRTKTSPLSVWQSKISHVCPQTPRLECVAQREWLGMDSEWAALGADLIALKFWQHLFSLVSPFCILWKTPLSSWKPWGQHGPFPLSCHPDLITKPCLFFFIIRSSMPFHVSFLLSWCCSVPGRYIWSRAHSLCI